MAPPTLYEHNFSGNYPKIAAQKMMFEAMKEFFWAPFSKFSTPKESPVNNVNRPQPTNSIIVMQQELNRKQGDMIEIPIFRQMKNLPKTGTKQLEGHEERRAVNFAAIPIMLSRHADNPQNSSMERRSLNEVDLVETSKPALQRHYVRTEEYLGASYALYHGYSWNIFDSGWYSSQSKIRTNGVTGASHPHIYCAGPGKVEYTGASGYPGTAAYETQIGTDVTAIQATDVLDTGLLQALKADPQIRKIPPIILKDGNVLRLLVVHPWQITTLENDPQFQTIASRAMVQQLAKDNPFLVAAKYIYAGFAIYESDTAVFQVNVTGGKPVWGPSTVTDLDSFESYASATKFGAMVLGSNALYKAMGSPMEFKRMTKDYDEYMGISYRIIQGYARSDFWNRDDGSDGEFLVNDNSAIVVTYAESPAF